MNFLSDNGFGVADEIMKAIQAANAGTAASYGEDAVTEAVTKRLAEVFETSLTVLLVPTGTAANALSLAAFTPPWGVIFAHLESHIAVEECGAVEFYTGGAKIEGLAGWGAKITPSGLSAALENFHIGMVHSSQPAAISLTQSSECGTVYSPEEIQALCAIARQHQLAVHMDGARLANAIAALGCTPAQITWRAGVDVLSFGATKNGAMAADAVIVFDPEKAQELGYRRKRAGHLLSKQRFVAAQFAAYLEDDYWLALAGHANAMAHRLSTGLVEIPGVELAWPTQANEVFPILPDSLDQHLQRSGAHYHPWTARGLAGTRSAPGDNQTLVRLVTSFATTRAQVDGLLKLARQQT